MTTIFLGDRSCLKPSTLHKLPCTIKHDGHAPVEEMFRFEPEKAENESGAENCFVGTFRGRKLQGSEIRLPKGATGVVLAKRMNDQGTFGADKVSSTEEGEEESVLEVEAVFDCFYAWNHDQTPSTKDPVHSWIKYVEIAKQLHSQV